MHTLILAGRIGRNAETRITQAGKSVTGFPLAVDIGWGDSKKTLWADCAIWGERGEKLMPHLVKGLAVTVRGLPGARAYTSRGSNEPSAVLTCMVDEIELQGGGRRDDQQGQQRQQQPSGGGWTPPADLDDEIPFARADDGLDLLIGKRSVFVMEVV